jgi:hypothetical protein
MTSFALILQLLLLPVSKPAQQNADAIAKISFEITTIKLGDIYQGERYERVFKFTNTGDAPLIINDIETACGCTVVKFSKEPVMPGKTGEIKVDYVPKKSTLGFISKSFVITSNAKNNPEYLYLHGNVVKKKKRKRRK